MVVYMWLLQSKLVSAVYNLVLLNKGFHLAILLLPAARQAGAHAKYRCVINKLYKVAMK